MPTAPTAPTAPAVRHAARPVTRSVASLAVVLAAGFLMPPQLGAQTQQDVDQARSEQQDVRARAEEVASRIDVLDGRAADVAVDLDLLDITISVATSRLEVATARADGIAEELANLEGEIARLEVAKGDLQALIVQSVIDQYVTGREQGQRSVLSSDDPVNWSLRQSMYALIVTDINAVQDQLRVIDDRLESAHAAQAALAAAAAVEIAEVDRLRADAEAAQAAQLEVLGKLQERIERRLAEAEALASLDAELSEEIRRGEEEIARRLAVAEALQRQREREAAGTDSGQPTESSRKNLIARPDEIVNVRGIEIHVSLADQLLGLMNAAESAGIILGGAGWRSTEYQIELRMQNCGTTDYLIFDAPSEACYPPTARPATSNHEAGTAVDFTANGRAVVDRHSTAFQWLAANAPSYGFYNLWSEPWHWSVDGR